MERPERYRNAIVPHIYVDGASDGIAFYKRAFGAVELFRIVHPGGTILHAELSINGSVFMIGDPDGRLYGEPRALGRCTAGLHIFTDDNAALLERAVAAGAQQIQPPTDVFYGASSASLRDPYGHVWVLLTWKEDLDPDEIERRGRASLSSRRREHDWSRGMKAVQLAAAAFLSGCNSVATAEEPEKTAPGVTQAHKGAEGSATMNGTKHRATGHTDVKSYDPTAYDPMEDGPSLLENRVDEVFTGDIDGEGTVRVIQAARKDGSGTFVGIERVRGAVGGRKGSFLLQVSGTDVGTERRAEWFVIPGSGTGNLKGLRGEGGFKAQRGQQGSVWLDYYFE